MKRAFGASRKVAKEQRGVNYANQRFQNGGFSVCDEGITDLCANVCETLA
ncbi:MAG: hypothetical protein IH977_03695 [Nitrospinae bacterium]|nr:hypothetical protein [Nitrospinota bacterium]